MKTYESPLQEAAERFPQTLLWNDSCGVADLNLALRHGAPAPPPTPSSWATFCARRWPIGRIGSMP